MKGDTLQGVRVYNKDPHQLEIGEYGKFERDEGAFCGCCPNGLLCNLKSHRITVHSDGTITADPSILCTGAPGESWHGYLEKGIWREV